jgi:hypothetical protein
VGIGPRNHLNHVYHNERRKIMIRTALSIAGVVAAAATALAVPALAAPSDHLDNQFMDIVSLEQGSVTLTTTCPSDPPQSAYVTFPGTTIPSASKDVTCDGNTQTIVLSFDACLAEGTEVFVKATISGDSGEINDEGTYVVGN